MKTIMLTMLLAIGFEILLIQAANLTDTDRLVTDLFTNYSKALRPPFNQSQILNVHMGFYLFSINEFDEIEGILSVIASPLVLWVDYRLSWNPLDYGNLVEITVPKTMIWIPNIFVVNPAMKMEAIGTDDYISRITFAGLISWVPGGIIKSTCKVDMTYFPFDTQKCDIVIAAWGYLPYEIIIKPLSKHIDFKYFQTNQMWDVESTKLERHALAEYDGVIKAELTLKRKPVYFSLNILAPILLLCVLNPLVFLLPIESGERVSYAVTIFLSFAVFMTLISEQLPKVSEPIARLSYLIFGSMAFSTIICILAILVMRLYYKDERSRVPRWLQTVYQWFDGGYCFKSCKNKVKDKDIDSNKESKDIVTEIHVLEFQSESHEKESISATNISWKDIAMMLDKILFTGSIAIVILFMILICMLLLA